LYSGRKMGRDLCLCIRRVVSERKGSQSCVRVEIAMFGLGRFVFRLSVSITSVLKEGFWGWTLLPSHRARMARKQNCDLFS